MASRPLSALTSPAEMSSLVDTPAGLNARRMLSLARPHGPRSRLALPAPSAWGWAGSAKRARRYNQHATSSAWHLVQAAFVLFPTGTTHVERPNTLQLARCKVSYQA